MMVPLFVSSGQRIGSAEVLEKAAGPLRSDLALLPETARRIEAPIGPRATLSGALESLQLSIGRRARNETESR